MIRKEYNAKEDFGNPMGTDSYIRHRLSGLIYTEGVKDMADTCKAYWLIDLIGSYAPKLTEEQKAWLTWDLQVAKDDSAVITADDGNGNKYPELRQEIPYTDLPYTSVTVWQVGGVLLMPKEY